VAGRRPVASLAGLGPPTREVSCSGR